MNINMALKMVKVERQGEAFPGSDGKTDAEWSLLGAIARYITDLRDSCSTFRPDELPDLFDSELKQLTTENASLWELAMQKKKQYLDERGARQTADRSQLIKEQLADFAEL